VVLSLWLGSVASSNCRRGRFLFWATKPLVLSVGLFRL